MKRARVEIIGNPGKFAQCPFTAEFQTSSSEQIKSYMRQLADGEGLTDYIVYINDEVYFQTGITK